MRHQRMELTPASLDYLESHWLGKDKVQAPVVGGVKMGELRPHHERLVTVTGEIWVEMEGASAGDRDVAWADDHTRQGGDSIVELLLELGGGVVRLLLVRHRRVRPRRVTGALR